MVLTQMFCVYNNRPFAHKALQASALLASTLFHLAIVVGLSRWAASFEWQQAAGNRGRDQATEVSLWTRAGANAPKSVSPPMRSRLDEPTATTDSPTARPTNETLASKPTSASGVGAGGNSTEYRAVLHALLNASKTYPRILRELRLSGVVNVRFRVSRDGFLNELEVLDKQTEGPLQAEALRFLKRVDRVPVPPAELNDEQLRFELPLRYEGRG
jgi:periplasmic protein TonB